FNVQRSEFNVLCSSVVLAGDDLPADLAVEVGDVLGVLQEAHRAVGEEDGAAAGVGQVGPAAVVAVVGAVHDPRLVHAAVELGGDPPHLGAGPVLQDAALGRGDHQVAARRLGGDGAQQVG